MRIEDSAEITEHEETPETPEGEPVPAVPRPEKEAPAPAEAAIVFGGKEWHPLLTLASFRFAQMKHGVTIKISEVEDIDDMAMLTRLAWISCLREDPEMTEESFLLSLMEADPVMEHRMINVVRAGFAAIIAASPAAEDGEKK